MAAISYPINTPTEIGFAEITFMSAHATSISKSPFTFQSQVQNYSGQLWKANVVIPPCKRENAEPWVSFLLKLKGNFGTFLMGDPNGTTPRGVGGGSPTVNGSNQTGDELNVSSASLTSVSGWLLSGDYIQIGNRLHKVIEDASLDSSGDTTLRIWPDLRSSPTNATPIILNNTKGTFRLSDREAQWAINNSGSSYSISFNCEEVI